MSTLIRGLRTLTQAGETPTSIAADSANIAIEIDNIDTGQAERESLQSNLDELVLILNDLGVGGSVPDASTTVKGIVEEADDTEIDAGTDTGATGARLFVVPSKLRSLINYDYLQYETNVISTLSIPFYGNTSFVDVDFDTLVIDSVTYSTLTDAQKQVGTSPTSRADLTAVNSFSESIGAVGAELIINVSFDATFITNGGGTAAVHVRRVPKLT